MKKLDMFDWLQLSAIVIILIITAFLIIEFNQKVKDNEELKEELYYLSLKVEVLK